MLTMESLTLAPNESTVEKKMARLYLVSDILHNSSAPFPKTGQFRSRLEGKLPAIMDSLRQVNHLAAPPAVVAALSDGSVVRSPS